MSQPDPTYDPRPIADSMPPIPTFEPAPVPKPVVTDTMPPIPVTAPVPTQPPVKPAGMPALNTTPTPAPVQPMTLTDTMPTFAPANPAASAAPAAPVIRPTVPPAAPAAPAAPVAPLAAPASPAAPANPFMRPNPNLTQPTSNPMPDLSQGKEQAINPSMSAALDEALRSAEPSAPKPATPAAPAAPNAPVAPNAPSTPNVPATPNTPAMPNAPVMPNAPATPNAAPAAPNAAPVPNMAAAPNPAQPEFKNPFMEAMERNKEIRNVSFSSQDSKPLADSTAKNKKILIIAASAAAILVLLIIGLVVAMSANQKTTPNPTPNPTPTSKAGSYVCKHVYLDSELELFGDTATAANESYTLRFGEAGLNNVMLSRVVTYDDVDAAKKALNATINEFTSKYELLGLEDDPVSSIYKREDSSVRITRKASEINDTNLSLMDINTTEAASSITSDSLQDLFEAQKFTCEEINLDIDPELDL